MQRNKIIAFIDFFYPPFNKIIPQQTFRYGVCGGLNTILSIIEFNFLYKNVFGKQNIVFKFMVIKSYNAALIITTIITFTIGFLLLKFVVFTDSNIKSKIQLFRYLISYFVNLTIMYLLMNAFVEHLHVNATTSQLIITVIVIVVSYLTQKYFTFKIK